MSKIEFEKGKYILYTNEVETSQILLGQKLTEVYELRNMMSDLLVEYGPAWHNFRDNTSEERLNIHFHDEKSLIFDKDSTSKGRVRQRKIEQGNFYYDLAYRYPDIAGHDANFRLAHELGHLMLNPSTVKQQTYDESTDTRQISGLIRVPNGQERNAKARYGEKMQENAINLIAQLAIRGKNSADDIIAGKVDLSEDNSYKKVDDLVRILVAAMRNDFDKEITFEQLAQQKLDSQIKHADGTKEPANIFLYGILNDSSIIEKEFDKYMGEGAWRQLDSSITQLHLPDIDKSKFDNIYQSARKLILQFTNERLKDKQKDIQSGKGNKDFSALKKQIEMINEIINGLKTNKQTQEQPQDAGLSLKQKIAQLLKKNDFLMKLPFLESFANKQLNVLPSGTQSKSAIMDKLKQEFKEGIKCVDLPNSQRMSDPNKVQNMQIKMKPKLSGR